MWALGNTLAKRGKTYDQIELENARLGVKDGDSGLLQVNGNTGVRTYRGVQYIQLPDGSWGITGMAPHDKSGKLLPDPRDQETYRVAQNGRAFAKDQNGNWVMLDSKQDQLNKMTKDFSERGASKEQLRRFTNDPTIRNLLTHYDDLSPATRKSLSDVMDAARNAKRIPSLSVATPRPGTIRTLSPNLVKADQSEEGPTDASESEYINKLIHDLENRSANTSLRSRVSSGKHRYR